MDVENRQKYAMKLIAAVAVIMMVSAVFALIFSAEDINAENNLPGGGSRFTSSCD